VYASDQRIIDQDGYEICRLLPVHDGQSFRALNVGESTIRNPRSTIHWLMLPCSSFYQFIISISVSNSSGQAANNPRDRVWGGADSLERKKNNSDSVDSSLVSSVTLSHSNTPITRSAHQATQSRPTNLGLGLCGRRLVLGSAGVFSVELLLALLTISCCLRRLRVATR
jgi:hypothetical protein